MTTAELIAMLQRKDPTIIDEIERWRAEGRAMAADASTPPADPNEPR